MAQDGQRLRVRCLRTTANATKRRYSKNFWRRIGVLSILLRWLAALVALSVFASAVNAEKVRVGVLKFGTVNWELDVVETHGFAEKRNVDVQVVPLASKRATAVALQGGAVDIIVSDWIWVSRQRAEGKPYVFVPYSLAVGGLMVRPDANINALGDLESKRVGVAGGPVDKSWLLMRAYARRNIGKDLADLVEPNFAAPPLLNQLMLRGELPAVLNFWHYTARLEAKGMQQLLSVREVLTDLGIESDVPLLGWVFSETWARDNKTALLEFLGASFDAKHKLAKSDEEWARLRPLLKAADQADADALMRAYRAGIPRKFEAVELEAARRVFDILAKEGGAELIGKHPELAQGTFWSGFDIPHLTP